MAEQTPLYAEHLKRQGKIVEFAGFLLPVQFTEGIAAEHRAVREGAGLFDVSHMGEIEIRGRDTFAFLDYLLPRDLSKIAQSIARKHALYSVMCAADGTAVDDLLIYPMSADCCLLVVNASNIAADEAHIRGALADWASSRAKASDVIIDNQSSEWAQIALQGPKSLDILAQMATLLPDGPTDTPLWLAQLKTLGRYCFTNLCLSLSSTDNSLEGTDLLVSRTGYTGEDGFEFYLQPQDAPDLWNLLIAAGAVPVGLGARDTLRLEAAMPLYGHELSRSITPREAGLDRFMAISKPHYIGREVLQDEPSRILIGLAAEGKAIPRADYPVLAGDRVVGHVTSGTFSPTLGKGIAMALVDRAAADSPTLAVEIRGRAEPFTHCKLPFV
ncbi:MAG: glycine cleavage system aminomethyltransferase [Firmicutes bacterium]|nr:glycine cleavage system aminomethyltransferase [Bacillota bacterium]